MPLPVTKLGKQSCKIEKTIIPVKFQVPTSATFSKGIRRKPTVLILDKEIQGLPWESMNFLKGHPMSRVPSIHTLALLFKAFNHKESVVPGKIRYFLLFF